jgi:hypothetical protein
MQVAKCALALGLEVWLSSALWDRPAEVTLGYYVSAAERAEERGGAVVFGKKSRVG